MPFWGDGSVESLELDGLEVAGFDQGIKVKGGYRLV